MLASGKCRDNHEVGLAWIYCTFYASCILYSGLGIGFVVYILF